MIKAIIVDDDPLCANTMELFVKNFTPQVSVLGYAQTISTAVQLIKEHQPNLIFLDVELVNEKGFDLFKHFPNPNFEVVFCTAHEKYAVQAIKLSCFDFLIKPIDSNELILTIEKFERKNHDLLTGKRIEVLLDSIKNNETKKIAIPSHNSITFINTNEIVCCLGESKYTTVYTNNGEKIMSSKNLGEFESLLNSAQFFRSHKSWIVNLSYVKKLIKTDNQILLTNDMLVDVSTRKKDDFLKLFEKL